MASDTCAAAAGLAAAAASANWASASQRKKLIPWLPPRTEPLYPGGPPLGRAYRLALEEFAERLGGILGSSITDVATSVSLVQEAVTLAQSIAIDAQVASAQNAAAIDVVRDVAIGNGLTGAEQIP